MKPKKITQLPKFWKVQEILTVQRNGKTQENQNDKTESTVEVTFKGETGIALT